MTEAPPALAPLAAAVQVLAALVVFVALHETGHVLLARAFGDRGANFVLIGRRGGKWVTATTFTRFARVENWEGVKVALAGPLFTRLLAELVLVTALFVAIPQAAGPFVLTLFILARTDFWLYTVRDFCTAFLMRRPLPGRDIADAVRVGSGLVGQSQARLFALLLTVSTLDLALGWPRALAFFSGSGGLL